MALGALADCSSKDTFAAVNAAARDLDPSALGQVSFDQTAGSGQPLTQGRTRFVLVLFSGDQAAARSAADARLSAARFSPLGVAGWRRTDGDATVIASVTLVPGGQKPPLGPGVPANQVGVFFNLSSGG